MLIRSEELHDELAIREVNRQGIIRFRPEFEGV